MNRKVVFLGRSLAKYAQAGENVGLVNFSKEVEIVKYGAKIKKKLSQIQKKGKKPRERNLELEKGEKLIQPKVFTYPSGI